MTSLLSRRFEHLYEISKLLARFENVAQTFDPALAIAARTLPIRSAILIESEGTASRMMVWPSAGHDPEAMEASRANAESIYAYLVGAASAEELQLTEKLGPSTLPWTGPGPVLAGKSFITIPLVVARRWPFGALQLEGCPPLDKPDLMFVDAIANQLAVALDRDRAWRRDILRRQQAEVGQAAAEARGESAERARVMAESLSARHQALANENAHLYQQAQRAVSMREQILAVVSHDLRTPLQTILMSCETAARPDVRPSWEVTAARVHRSAERMQRLIQDLLDFANIEAGRLAMRRLPEDPTHLVNETLASFEGIARERHLLLTSEVAQALPQADCDRDRILQVLGNLVGNATKITPEGGRVTLRVESRGHELLFSVSDTGPGIEPDDFQHLFERYWRSGSPRYAGTGLGLAICRGIVDAHGGRIWAESELGHGATLFFTLPALSLGLNLPEAPGSSNLRH